MRRYKINYCYNAFTLFTLALAKTISIDGPMLKSKKPNEVPQPEKKPEIVPAEEPGTWPAKEPDIKPGKEPLTSPPVAPPELPNLPME